MKILIIKDTKHSKDSEPPNTHFSPYPWWLIDYLLFQRPWKKNMPFFHKLVIAFLYADLRGFFTLLKKLPDTIDGRFWRNFHNLLNYILMRWFILTLMEKYKLRIHINIMKRVSYVFKSFDKMKIRIFSIHQLIKTK